MGVEDGVAVRVAVGSVVAVGVALAGTEVLVAGTAVTEGIGVAVSTAGAEQAVTSNKNSSQWKDFLRVVIGFIIVSS